MRTSVGSSSRFFSKNQTSIRNIMKRTGSQILDVTRRWGLDIPEVSANARRLRRSIRKVALIRDYCCGIPGNLGKSGFI
jgi:hypothetical protein